MVADLFARAVALPPAEAAPADFTRWFVATARSALQTAAALSAGGDSQPVVEELPACSAARHSRCHLTLATCCRFTLDHGMGECVG